MTTWASLLETLAVCMMRPLGVMLLLPVMEARLVGGTLIRNTLVLIIALPILPMALQSSPLSGSLVTVALTELVTGLFIGLLAAIPFWAILVAGEFIDNVRGAGLSGILNPSSGEETSLFSVLFLQLLTALFFMTGSFNQLLDAIYRSYNVLSIGQPLSLSQDTADFMIAQWRIMLDLGLSFALPAVVIMFMVDIALGLINRSVEQLDVFFLAMPLKSLLACLAMFFSMQFALGEFFERFSGIWAVVYRLVR